MKLSKENQEWFDHWLHFEGYHAATEVEKKLLTDQQRIQELEKECLNAKSYMVELSKTVTRLISENSELKVNKAELLLRLGDNGRDLTVEDDLL